MQAQPNLQDVLGSRYQLEAELGSGAQGTVYRAYDRRLDRYVAVKFLRPDVAPLLGPERFQREIAIAARLSHPNIVPLLDSGGEGDTLYYTMPVVEGESLRTRLRRQPQLPLEDAFEIVRNVAAGLDYAHERGYVHRDIKPENILLDGERAIVLDFGIARAIEAAGEEAITSGNLVIGTPLYMSPEQAAGQKQLDGCTDIYALGCVLYEMLSGAPPFMGGTPQAVIARHIAEPPPSLSVVRRSVSPALEEAIGKALAKVPADRYSSGAQMVQALERAQHHPGGRARIRRRLKQGALLLVPAAVALSAYLAWPTTVLDSNKVMGFPFLEHGSVSTDVVEQVEEAIAAAMQDTEPLRWLRARLFLGGGRRTALPADSATTLARKRGARYWLGGSVSKVADSLMVRLELFDAQGDSVVASRSETGPPNTAGYVLAFRAINGLLPKIVGRSTHVTDKYLERYRPAAVAKWLEGEVAYRNARYRDALNYYRAALASDSSLVAAALKGAMAAAWLSEYPAGDTLIQLALTREADLPPLNRVFAHGLQQQFAGNGDSAIIFFRRAVQTAPEWSEGWYGVGEAAYHLWPSGDNLDSIARVAYQQSFRLDPDFAPVVFHLAELTIMGGRLKEAEQLVERHRSLSADAAQQLQLDLMLECVRKGASTVDWSPLARQDESGASLLAAGRILAAGGRHLTCAEGAFRAALFSAAPDEDVSRRWSAARGLHHIFIARGENIRAQKLADSVVASGLPDGRGLRVLDALLGTGPDSTGAAEMRALEQPMDSMDLRRLWWFGEWSAAHADTARLDSVTNRLREIADRSGNAADRVPARVMAARLRLLRGDTATALDGLQTVRPVAPLHSLVWRHWESLAPERMLLARTLLARGRPAEALRVAESFDGQRTVVDLAYLRPSLELRREVAQRTGDRSGVEEYQRRLAALSR